MSIEARGGPGELTSGVFMVGDGSGIADGLELRPQSPCTCLVISIEGHGPVECRVKRARASSPSYGAWHMVVSAFGATESESNGGGRVWHR